ncbi:MAG: hypothetical protein LBU53_03980 [Zoogloeaceae bacterium]|jgi:hypothetical protein|nr:hypothetical protein [Zoogloeaceae bacterium]
MKAALLIHVGNGTLETMLAVFEIQAVVIFGAVVTAAFLCCWRDWFLFVYEKLRGN